VNEQEDNNARRKIMNRCVKVLNEFLKNFSDQKNILEDT
jgi:hypothetical protein